VSLATAILLNDYTSQFFRQQVLLALNRPTGWRCLVVFYRLWNELVKLLT